MSPKWTRTIDPKTHHRLYTSACGRFVIEGIAHPFHTAYYVRDERDNAYLGVVYSLRLAKTIVANVK